MSVRHADPSAWHHNKHHLDVKGVPEDKQNPRRKREGYQENLTARQMQAAPAQLTKAVHKGPTQPKSGGETFQKDLADRKIGTYHSVRRGRASRFA